MTSRHVTWIFIALLALAWGFLPPFTVTLLNYIGLYSMVAVGLVLLTGVGGMTSFGQAAFVGLGAYATAWVSGNPQVGEALAAIPPGLLPWLGLLLGLAVTALVAWALGAVTLRLSGHYLPLGTIAWGLSLYYIFGNLQVLGGHTGLAGLPSLGLFGLDMTSPRVLGVFIWALLLVMIWALHNLLDSREGRAIRSLKTGRVMAESMGVDTARQRIKLFVLAALLAAVSGWLYAHLQRFVNPTPFNLNIGIEYLFMAVVGGSGYLWGAVLGATLITLLKAELQDWLPKLLGTSGNFEIVVFGLLMLLVLQRAAGAGHRGAGCQRRDQALRRPGGQQRRQPGREGGRGARADRPQRRRQEHLLQHDLGRGRPHHWHRQPDGPAHGRQALARVRQAGPGPHLPARAPAGPAQRARERGPGRAPARPARLGGGHAAH